uniref:Mitochondrial amidoxime reducing component 2-like n=1 Tax=Tanacetum cinerariifolium TaxID=118510 RepID=A0A699I0B1_TANCI|nr:mitochondrial amidoxime reducing component 2-like [Tanacetum cinerariifolium]
MVQFDKVHGWSELLLEPTYSDSQVPTPNHKEESTGGNAPTASSISCSSEVDLLGGVSTSPWKTRICRGTDQQSLYARDCHLVVVNSKREGCTQRVKPKLALIQVELPTMTFSLGWVPTNSSYMEKMSRDVLTIGSTMRIPLLYRGEYSQWVERFMNYLEEQTDGEAMINCIKNGDQPLPRVTQVSIAGTSSTEQPPLKDKSMWKSAVLYEYETLKATEGELLFDTYIQYLQNKNLMDINIDALYNILKQNQGDVNDAIGSKKKTVVVIFDPLALIAKKTNVSRSKEKVVVSLDSEGSEADDFSKFKKITSLLAKAFNQRKFYSKPTNTNLRTLSTS